MEATKTIEKGNILAEINLSNAQMFRLVIGGEDLMWKGGGPGWDPKNGLAKSEYLAFPILGTPMGGKIVVDGRGYQMCTNGITQLLPWERVDGDDKWSLTMQQTFNGGGVIFNGTAVEFPKSFQITKSYSVEESKDGKSLQFVFRVGVKCLGDWLPFSLSWHAFIKNLASASSLVRVTSYDGKRKISFPGESVVKARDNALMFNGCGTLDYPINGKSFHMEHDYGIMRLYDLGKGYVSTGPTTVYPLGYIQSDGSTELGLLPGYKILRRDDKERLFTITVSRRG